MGVVVLYTERVEACRDFYAGLGLEPVREQHGGGPLHYAATLPDGLVLEIYPAGTGAPTGRLRLELDVTAGPLPAGRHTLRDPDGRAVVVNAEGSRASPDDERRAPLCGRPGVSPVQAGGSGGI